MQLVRNASSFERKELVLNILLKGFPAWEKCSEKCFPGSEPQFVVEGSELPLKLAAEGGNITYIVLVLYT